MWTESRDYSTKIKPKYLLCETSPTNLADSIFQDAKAKLDSMLVLEFGGNRPEYSNVYVKIGESRNQFIFSVTPGNISKIKSMGADSIYYYTYRDKRFLFKKQLKSFYKLENASCKEVTPAYKFAENNEFYISDDKNKQTGVYLVLSATISESNVLVSNEGVIYLEK